MDDCALDDPIEAERRFGLDGFLARHRGKGAVEHLFEVAFQLRQVDAAAREDLACLRILDQRVQHVLERDEIVTAIRRHAKRSADALERIWRKRHGSTAHSRVSWVSGSMVTSNGYSCCSASRWVALTLVSATSRVNSPATPMPDWWTCIMTAKASAGGMPNTVSSTQTTNSCVVKSSLCRSTFHNLGCSTRSSISNSGETRSRNFGSATIRSYRAHRSALSCMRGR